MATKLLTKRAKSLREDRSKMINSPLFQVARALTASKDTPRTEPPSGSWLRDIRFFMGLSTEEAGRRMDRKRQSIVSLENSELKGSVSISSLRHAAAAMGFEVVYSLVPHSEDAKRRLEEVNRVVETFRQGDSSVQKIEDGLKVLSLLESAVSAQTKHQRLLRKLQEIDAQIASNEQEIERLSQPASAKG